MIPSGYRFGKSNKQPERMNSAGLPSDKNVSGAIQKTSLLAQQLFATGQDSLSARR
jgi:hypothetical protein